MVRLSEIDLNTSHLVAAGIGAATYHLYTVYKSKETEKKAVERRQEAENFGRAVAQYIVEDMRGRGVPQSEAYAVTNELIQLLREVKDELKQRRQ